MERNAMKDLVAWKKKANRKPLLLYGARQVGKTYLVKQFGEKYFDDIIYVNFETNNIIGNVIDENIEPEYIIKNLEIIFNKKIDKNNTLIFFDEIQKNTRALTSLKYFYEKAKEYVKGNGEVVAIRKDQSLANYQAGCKDIRTRIEKMLSCEIKRAKHNARLKEYGPVWQDAWLARAGSYEYILERIRQSVL